MSIGSFSSRFLQLYCLWFNWFKNVEFFNIFVKLCLYSNFYQAKYFFDKSKKVFKLTLYNFGLMLLFDICTLNGQKMEKKNILRKNSPEIAHLANFFTLMTPIYFLNEHRLLCLFFSPTVLILPQNWFKNVYFFYIFVKSCLYSNFYEANFFLTI